MIILSKVLKESNQFKILAIKVAAKRTLDNALLLIREFIKTCDKRSEDIDLAVDRSLFGFEGDLTKKQIKKLRKASSLFVKDTFCPALQEAVEKYGLQDFCKIESEPDGEGDSTYPEPRKIFVRYKSAWAEPSEYLSPIVMLEIGARSLLEPNEQTHINSMVEGVFPTIQTTIVDSKVATALASKTFLERYSSCTSCFP